MLKLHFDHKCDNNHEPGYFSEMSEGPLILTIFVHTPSHDRMMIIINIHIHCYYYQLSFQFQVNEPKSWEQGY